MPAKLVFISHSSKDDSIVRELRHALEGLGIEVWADSERLSGGDPLNPAIQEGIEKADYFLVIVSLNALNSDWVQREIKHAESARKKIIPLMRSGIGSPILSCCLARSRSESHLKMSKTRFRRFSPPSVCSSPLKSSSALRRKAPGRTTWCSCLKILPSRSKKASVGPPPLPR
jgi:hypothetical protein